MTSPTILPDSEALLQIKEGSRKIYIKAFDGLREYIGNDLETRPPCENEMLQYIKSSAWRKDSPPHRLFNDQWEYISTSKAAVKNVANKLLGTNCESINPTSTRQIEMSINRKQITNTAAG